MTYSRPQVSVEFTAEATLFPWIEQVLQHGSAGEAFEELAARFRRDKQYRLLFDARLMQTRLQLGLPLVSTSRIGDVPKELQDAYQKGYLDAAREVGALLLADGNIPRAWPYFRAIGETTPVAHALDTFDPPDPNTPESHEALAATIQIAFHEGLHPRKGFELILKHYGLCRAITMFTAHPEGAGRHESVRLLVRSLHGQLVENLRRAIADVEGSAPDNDSVTALIERRDWLFANNAQHTDSSHIAPVLKFAAELEDTATLRLAVEIADYASHLDAMFQYADDPPFENTYTDHGVYLRILAGEDVDRGIAHFEQKAVASDPDTDGHRPAEVLVKLLVRLSRYNDAITTFRRYLSDVAPEELTCPPLPRLCQMAGDFAQLKEVAREQRDPLSYMAALIQGGRGKG